MLKRLDKYIGIPLINLLGAFRRRRKLPKNIQRIGLLKTAAIGDTILISGITADIEAAYPNAEIDFFAGSSNIEIAKLCLPERVRRVLIPVKEPAKALAIIREKQYDIFIDFGAWPRIDALLCGLSRARFRLGFSNEGQHRHRLFDDWAPHNNKFHEYRNYRELIKRINVHGTHMPAVPFSKNPDPQRRIALHMFPGGSKAALRAWPEERWLALANHFTKLGYEVMLTGAPADKAKAEALQAKADKPEKVSPYIGHSLPETAEMLRNCQLVYSVDTGIMHLAAASGCNLVSLHGPTPAARWGPLNTNSIKLEPGPECLRCGNLGFEDCSKNRQCINDITVQQAIAASVTFLQEYNK